ncbi:MAG TPA: ROK family transcriptional regulator [Tepidisphaeraceae bacterium]|jgi:predicted NBD/HSP70 family sugar kinase|nr:ROK family transcriptional regulator [Tepidisphaeraceae bacterium]
MATPNDLRQMNRRRIVLATLRAGAASRSQLAQQTGLSQPTAGKIVDELIADRVLTDHGEPIADPAPPPRLGRPSHMLRLDGGRLRFLAIHLGVVHTRVAALAVAPRLSDVWSQITPTAGNFKDWLGNVRRMAAAALPRRPEAVLISVPGVVDESAGRSLLSSNLRWIEGVDLLAEVGRALNAPVHVVQECACLAMGQHIIDPASPNFLHVDFGTGVGGAAMIGGTVYRGPLPLASELGHTPVAGNVRKCGCGGTGCLETMVSRDALAMVVTGGRGYGSGGWQATVDRVTRHGVGSALGESLDAAGLVIAGAINMMGLNRVVLTGSVTELPGTVERIASAVRAGAMWERFGEIDVRAVPRHRLAGLAMVAIDRLIAPPVDDRADAAR